MKQSYTIRQKKDSPKGNARKGQALLEYRLGSAEAKAMLNELSKKYSYPAPSTKEIRAMLDKALGEQMLTEVLYKLREEE